MADDCASVPHMKVSRRHHYTPRYYLKRFENVDGAIWRLDTDSGAIIRGNNERFGYKKHWNTLRNPPPGYAPDWAEQRIAEVDGLAAAEITRILAGDYSTDLRDLDENQADKVGHWTEDFRLIVKLRTVLDGWRDYLPIHYSLRVIDPAERDARFLTSSNPLIDFSNKPSRLFPLSNRHCLFLSRDPKHRAIKPMLLLCDRATVSEINGLTLRNAWQYAYSCTPDSCS